MQHFCRTFLLAVKTACNYMIIKSYFGGALWPVNCYGCKYKQAD